MSRKRIAIIGTGIAGLGCAHFLYRHFDLAIFEQNARAGGHTNTVTVQEDGRELPVDTGFMVFNHVTYPLLTRLFRELGVETKPTDMSFAVKHEAAHIEYNGHSLNTIFGRRRQLFNLRFWRLLLQISRFNRETAAALDDPRFARMTLREYATARGYGRDFLDLYIVPMGGAVWSTPPEKMLQFPAISLMRFWHNHGFLGMKTRHPWWTVVNGAQSYVRKLAAPFRDRIRLNSTIARVQRGPLGVTVTPREGTPEVFDKVILAGHADQSLRMLVDAVPLERELLPTFQYQPNIATLHTDEQFMPWTKRCWASWNYRVAPDGTSTTHYWMNSLQGVSDKVNYFVSLNADAEIRPDKVLRRIEYEHPLFDLAAIDAQKRLPELNRISADQTTYYCGSYFRYGFHEDAFGSAVNLCRELLGTGPMVNPDGSAIYECRVMHHRLAPKVHRFEYRVFYLWLDLDEIDELDRALPLFSRNRWNLFSFRDGDHFDEDGRDVKARLLAWLASQDFDVSRIARIKLLTFPRVLGYIFNPVCFFYCFDSAGEPVCAITEVTNTYHEKKSYLLRNRDSDGRFRLLTPKLFYVSPFTDLDLIFDFKLRVPDENLEIHIDDRQGDARLLLSALTGTRRPLTTRSILACSIKYPLLTLRVIFLIHWHAFLLWLKRLPVHRKAADPHLQRDIHRPHQSIASKPGSETQ